MSDNLNRRQFQRQHSIIDEASPSCEHCGEQLGYNSRAAGKQSPRDPEKLLNGWFHRDGMLREHEATPPFGTSGEAEVTRTIARVDQARMQIRDDLSKRVKGY